MRQVLKIIFLMGIDAIIVSFSPFLSIYLRLEGAMDKQFVHNLLGVLPEIVFAQLLVFYCFRLYNRLWRYASINEAIAIVGGVSVSTLLVFSYVSISGVILPRSIHLLSWFLNILFIGASRFVVRVYHYIRLQNQASGRRTNVVIVGAGDAGAMIARELQQRYYAEKRLVGFIDDAEYKYNQRLFGAKVLGNHNDIPRIISQHAVDEIIIAIPSIGGSALREIVRVCKSTNCRTQIVPGLYELIDGKVSINQLRDIALEDLLRRDPVALDLEKITEYLRGKRVLVTGAGGSIGSELCRQIARQSPGQLLLLGKGENSIYEIKTELYRKFPQLDIRPIIADIRDKARIDRIFRECKPEVVFHAAAHKHVPLMEEHPYEAVANNIFGTKNVAEAAEKNETQIFVMISTDKAVNPTSVMGATKRIAEMIIRNMSKYSATRFVTVRFGNVLGSRGSVVPLFQKQILAGGPITITHPEIKRYFMTIPEASQLVLQAGSMAQGGEVFVLDMGEPVKIVDLACDLIELSGLTPHKDIKIEFIGLRPGEKLFEELMTPDEGISATKHQKIFAANLQTANEKELVRALLSLQSTYQPEKIRTILNILIPSYTLTGQKEAEDYTSSSGSIQGKAAAFKIMRENIR